MLGNKKFPDFDVSKDSVSDAYFPVVQMLCRLGRQSLPQEERWAISLLATTLSDLVMSAAMLLALQQRSLPSPPQVRHFTGQGERTIPEDADPSTEPFVWAASRLAMLASPTYETAFKAIEFHLAIPGIHVDPASEYSYDDMRDVLRRWAAFPGRGVLVVNSGVKTEEERAACESLLHELRKTGAIAAAAARDFVSAERTLALRKP